VKEQFAANCGEAADTDPHWLLSHTMRRSATVNENREKALPRSHLHFWHRHSVAFALSDDFTDPVIQGSEFARKPQSLREQTDSG
jgi:hypothetical protein